MTETTVFDSPSEFLSGQIFFSVSSVEKGIQTYPHSQFQTAISISQFSFPGSLLFLVSCRSCCAGRNLFERHFRAKAPTCAPSRLQAPRWRRCCNTTRHNHVRRLIGRARTCGVGRRLACHVRSTILYMTNCQHSDNRILVRLFLRTYPYLIPVLFNRSPVAAAKLGFHVGRMCKGVDKGRGCDQTYYALSSVPNRKWAPLECLLYFCLAYTLAL